VTPPIRSLTLERFLLGELPEAERAALDQALAADPGLRARLDELRASNLETTERYRASVVSREIRERSLNRRHNSRKALRHNLALAGGPLRRPSC
jgi:anti-sigma factor RsiW